MSSDTDSAFPSPEWITSGPCEKCGHVTFRKPSSYAPGQVAEAAEKRLGQTAIIELSKSKDDDG